MDEGIEIIDNALIEAIELRSLRVEDSNIRADGAEQAGGERGIDTFEELQGDQTD